MRNIGRVDIYNSSTQKYVEELGEKATGINGFIPWDTGTLLPGSLKKWQPFPFEPIRGHCYPVVHIISRR
ncbi:hypothetical protein [Winslowiella arboricola]|nr:hypothetical protein [Winslowiella arboricola]MCU5775495.1 hypothetical protein [Winslowiella arboricola]